MGRPKKKPAFLTKREWQVILAVEKYQGSRLHAGIDLDVTESAIESSLSRIRIKMKSAYTFKRNYGKLLERKE